MHEIRIDNPTFSRLKNPGNPRSSDEDGGDVVRKGGQKDVSAVQVEGNAAVHRPGPRSGVDAAAREGGLACHIMARQQHVFEGKWWYSWVQDEKGHPKRTRCRKADITLSYQAGRVGRGPGQALEPRQGAPGLAGEKQPGLLW
eukprot:scaffold2848_cov352-Pavlova_lutheri.AAC.46